MFDDFAWSRTTCLCLSPSSAVSSIVMIRSSSGIYFERTGGWAVGDLHFCIDDTADNSNVDLTDTALIIKKDGKVGIGTTSPDSDLDIESAANTKLTIQSTNANGYPALQLQHPDRTWKMLIDGGTDVLRFEEVGGNKPFGINAGSSADVMRIIGSSVGIGTTSPIANLDVNGTIIGNFTSRENNIGVTETFVCLNGDVEAKTLTFENGILVDYT